jgi:hypothetical protein
MKTREEYVKHLKDQLDRWNSDVTKMGSAGQVRPRGHEGALRKELVGIRAQQEKARYNLTLLEKASATAWGDFTKGADDAWDRMRQAIDQARSHFEKSPK